MTTKKTILFLGDSITEGACASAIEKNYVSLVGKKLNLDSLNFGVGGTRIAKHTNPEYYPEYFLLRAKKMPSEADYVFVFGGTNDYGHGDAKIGSFEDKTDDTFYGALKNLIEYLVERYGKEKICFILPLKRYDEGNPYGDGYKSEPSLPLSGYVQIIKEVLSAYSVEYMCLDSDFPTPKTNKGDKLTMDGLHPNDIGHEIIANRIVEFLVKKGIV